MTDKQEYDKAVFGNDATGGQSYLGRRGKRGAKEEQKA
jgi:hypothetical protein